MSIQSKITSLISLIAIIFIFGVFYQFNSDTRSFENLLQDTKKQQITLFDQLLVVEGRNIEIFVRDYTFWDEMVEFVTSKDQAFAEDNIDTGLETFNADMAEVYDLGRSLVYAVGGKEAVIPPEVFNILDRDRFIYFFHEVPEGVMEIRGATIHPTDDSERVTAPRGYFFAGRILSGEYTQSLGDITRSSVTLISGGARPSDFDKVEAKTGYISFLRKLEGWNGQPVANLYVEKTFFGISQFYAALSRDFWIFSGLLLILALFIYGFLSYFVGRPLGILSRSIRGHDIEPIRGMGEDKSEFGDLAGLVLKFSEHDKVVKAKAYDDALLSAVGSGLVVVDENLHITFINKAGEELLGVATHEIAGKPAEEALRIRNEAGKKFAPDEMPLLRAMYTHTTLFAKFQLYRKGGDFFPVVGNIAPVIVNHKMVGAVMDFIDVTEEKKVETAKTEFVSLVSHQLRTPLTIIGWYLERLAKLMTSSEQTLAFREYIGAIAQANARMVKLVNATVEVSRIELGHLNPIVGSINISSVADEVVRELTPQISKKSIVFVKKIGPDLPPLALDERLVFIIIENILSNAVKYTGNQGHITLSVSKDKSGIRIDIADDGIGIAPEDEEKIFNKLFRSVGAREKDPEGTGLGLYIAKAMTERLGGTIGFVSAKGKGTVFTIRLPLASPKAGNQ